MAVTTNHKNIYIFLELSSNENLRLCYQKIHEKSLCNLPPEKLFFHNFLNESVVYTLLMQTKQTESQCNQCNQHNQIKSE